MEGVGARLGRSSTRYGPATVFSGPVRKWKKRWITLAAPNNSAAARVNGNAARSHLLLYKWAPVSSTPADSAAQPEEPPPRKFRYVPDSSMAVSDGPFVKIHDGLVAAENDLSSDGVKQLSIVLHYDIPFTHNLWHISVLEDQKQEDAEKLDETNEPSDADPSSQINQNVSSNTKPDMNDIVMGFIGYIDIDNGIANAGLHWVQRSNVIIFIMKIRSQCWASPVEPSNFIIFIMKIRSYSGLEVSDTEQNSADDNNLANLDLNLGLKATYNERETKSRNNVSDEGDQVEKINLDEEIEMNNRTDSEVPNKLKRKKLSPLTSK
ncbi:hypothetical protein ZIOFF_038862 [Zingiber officinale]|uniref:Uncharacterized protein n=1 Tax=Zingiber officinale TaxID=94328 RepID=A0A8J5L2L5_ZINOF|nr:hypothetical protein ZIOFF_038862 [Zingiber officinale]